VSTFDKIDGSSFYVPGKLYCCRGGASFLSYAINSENKIDTTKCIPLVENNILMYLKPLIDDPAWRVFLRGEKLIAATWWDSSIINYSFMSIKT